MNTFTLIINKPSVIEYHTYSQVYYRQAHHTFNETW